MKHIFSFLVIMCLAAMPVFAQSPQSFKYQAVVRNTDGNPYASKNIAMRISIVAGSVSGEAVYAETHQVTTTDLGLVNLEIGKGTPKTGTFIAINWSTGIYFVKVEFDPDGGSNYTLLGTSQLLSVPFALYAEKAGNGFSGDYNDLTNTPDLSRFLTTDQITPFTGSYNDLTDKPDLSKYLTADDITQSGVPKLRVSLTGDTLSLGKDNYVLVPGISAENHSQGATVPKILSVEVTNIGREGRYIDIEYTAKALAPPCSLKCVVLHNDQITLKSDEWGRTFAKYEQIGKNTWKCKATFEFSKLSYLPNGGYFLSGFSTDDDYNVKWGDIQITISGNQKPSTPILSDVYIERNGELYYEINTAPLSYITYTLTTPDNIVTNKTAWPSTFFGEISIVLGDLSIGSKISNIKGVDVWGQETEVWPETLVYDTRSPECNINHFDTGGGGAYWQINETDITCVFPSWVTPGMLTPYIDISYGATISPESGVAQNFFTENGVTYTVTAENGNTKTYTVKATVETP